MLRSAPRVGPQHNHAKSALRGVCSVGGRLILHGRRAHGLYFTGIECDDPVRLKKRAANQPQCWCGRPSLDGVGRIRPRTSSSSCASSTSGKRRQWALPVLVRARSRTWPVPVHGRVRLFKLDHGRVRTQPGTSSERVGTQPGTSSERVVPFFPLSTSAVGFEYRAGTTAHEGE